MENFGFLSIIPPIIAITLAIVTKEVLLSLFIGVLSGGLILSAFAPLQAMIKTFEIICKSVADPELWNIKVILVVVMLGGLVGLLNKSGGSKAFAGWVSNRIHSRRGAQSATWIMGILIFFDDYFNSLTIGTVMRPATDRYKISREKLAYILDSTAAPVCILAPVSSWVAYVSSLIASGFKTEGIQEQPFSAFLHSIPYNFYAWTAILMVGLVIFTKIEFGPMAQAEKRAVTTGKTYDTSQQGASDDDFKYMAISRKGHIMDLLVPVGILFAGSIFFMIYTGGYFGSEKTIGEAFHETDAASSLIYGTFFAIVGGIILFRARKSVMITDSINAMVIGMKSMFVAVCLLVMAWTIGSVCSELGTGQYLGSLIGDNVPGSVIPVAIFLFSCFTAFSTGASWGTFAIMIPIAIPLAVATDANMSACIAAVLGGGVFGDHCSPLADTTILSSTGAACNHMDHVKTQIPYAMTVAVCAAVGFLLAGILHTPFIPWITTLVLFSLLLVILHKFWGSDIQEELDMEINEDIVSGELAQAEVMATIE